MRKPILSDYGLSEDKIAEYEESFHKYNLALEKQNQENKIYNKKVLIGVIIMMIIYGVMFYVLGYAIGGWVLAIYFSLQTIVTLIVLAKDNTPRDDFILLLIFVTCIPLLGFGSLIYEALSHDENFINSQIPKSRYIDTSIEKKINEYKNDLEEWEQWQTKTSLEYWKNLSGYEFEKEIAKLYKKLRYGVTVTPKSGDGGVDIILEKDGKRIAVQCKHHAKPVGPAPVRELLGVVASQDFDSGIFISLNGYTKNAISEANLSKVQISLLSLYDILELLKEQEPDFSSTDMHTNSYHESEEETIDVNIPTYGEFIERELNRKNRNLFFSWEDKYHGILEYIKNNPPIEYSYETNMEDEDWITENEMYGLDGGAYGYKSEYYAYIDCTYIVHYAKGPFVNTSIENYILIQHHDDGMRWTYFWKKYNIPYDKLDYLEGLSDNELIDRMNLILKCLDKYPQYNLDPSYWIFKSQNDLKQYINTYTDTQKTSLESTSAKHCIDNCSTCNRDTCILDNSE